MVVEKANIIINGAGYTLQGNGNGIGIYFDCEGNVTVKNMQIRHFYVGVDVGSSTNNILSGNTITDNEANGINIDGGENKLYGNTIAKNGNYGILLYFSHNNTIHKNIITENKIGLYLYRLHLQQSFKQHHNSKYQYWRLFFRFSL